MFTNRNNTINVRHYVHDLLRFLLFLLEHIYHVDIVQYIYLFNFNADKPYTYTIPFPIIKHT